MGKQAPAAPDYRGAAEETAQADVQANRPNQTNAFNSTMQWTVGPDGRAQATQGFGGPFAGLAASLQQQAADMGGPMDWGQFGEMPTGDAARQQAIDAAYGQSSSRLTPMFGQREDALRERLLNQGVGEGSEAYRNAMDTFGRERNDAFQGAMNAAIGQGTQAGQAIFQQGMQGRQQAMAEALRRRGQPLSELQALQGFLAQPGFAQVQGPNFLNAAGMAGNYGLQAFDATNRANADFYGGLMDLLKSGAGAAVALSDARAKQGIVRLPVEALPGVPLAVWRYRPEYGPPGLRLGVVAQDLEKVAPQYVSRREDGMRLVDYGFLGAHV